MKAVLTYRLQSGETKSLCAYSFQFANLDGLQIVSGDKYYVDKAVSLGAKKPASKKKTAK